MTPKSNDNMKHLTLNFSSRAAQYKENLYASVEKTLIRNPEIISQFSDKNSSKRTNVKISMNKGAFDIQEVPNPSQPSTKLNSRYSNKPSTTALKQEPPMVMLPKQTVNDRRT